MNERALMAVVPVCPKCGLHALYTSRPTDLRREVVVVCGCGWTGYSPTVCVVPEPPLHDPDDDCA